MGGTAIKFNPESVQVAPDYPQQAGKSLWTATLKEWNLSDSDMVLLATACECADRLSAIREALEADGLVLVVDPSGRKRSHPLLAAEAQYHGVLLRAWRQLDLDDTEPPKVGRPPSRA